MSQKKNDVKDAQQRTQKHTGVHWTLKQKKICKERKVGVPESSNQPRRVQGLGTSLPVKGGWKKPHSKNVSVFQIIRWNPTFYKALRKKQKQGNKIGLQRHTVKQV